MAKLNFERNHALEAIARSRKNGLEWLYNSYPKENGNKRKSTTGFLMHNGAAYPVKPLGRLASEIANSPIEKNWVTDVFRKHFEQLGFQLINSPEDEAVIAVERQRRLANILARPEQAKFRTAVFGNFGARCLISGCESLIALQAAHIIPVSGSGGDNVWNGIPLRADLHLLFDADLIRLKPDNWKIEIVKEIFADYGQYDGMDVGDVINKTGYAEQLAIALRQRMKL